MNCRNGAPQSLMSKDLFCFNRAFIGGGRVGGWGGGVLVKRFRTDLGLSRASKSAISCVPWPLFLCFLVRHFIIRHCSCLPDSVNLSTPFNN